MIADPVRPTVHSEVARFHAWRRGDLTGRRLQRVDAAEAAMRRCFEVHADGVLTDAERDLLRLERAFDADGAAARVADPDALLLVIPRFLVDAQWHGDRIDRRIRYLIGWQLAHHVARLRETAGLDLELAMAAVRAAELHARRSLRRARADEAVPHLEESRPAGAVALEDVRPGPLRPEPVPPEPAALCRPFPPRRA